MKRVCVLCGTPDQGMKSDHLRECYWRKGAEQFDQTQYVPRLTYDERYLLQSGENVICSSRVRCRSTQQTNAKKT